MADTTPAVKTAPETSDAYAIVEASGTQIGCKQTVITTWIGFKPTWMQP